MEPINGLPTALDCCLDIIAFPFGLYTAARLMNKVVRFNDAMAFPHRDPLIGIDIANGLDTACGQGIVRSAFVAERRPKCTRKSPCETW